MLADRRLVSMRERGPWICHRLKREDLLAPLEEGDEEEEDSGVAAGGRSAPMKKALLCLCCGLEGGALGG